MDESVRRAMGKWPDVPAVYGWLSLDESGHWRLRGEPIRHPGLAEFIGRNYDCDDAGRWYFQNGPQRGYVRLDYTPWVLQVDGGGRLATHTGRAIAAANGAYVDDEDNLLLDTDAGIGLVDADALPAVAEWLVDDAGQPLDLDGFGDALARLRDGRAGQAFLRFGRQMVALAAVRRADVAARFGFEPDPRDPQQQ